MKLALVAISLALMAAPAAAPDAALPAAERRAEAYEAAVGEAERAQALATRDFAAAVPGHGERTVTAWYLRGAPVRLRWRYEAGEVEVLVDEKGRATAVRDRFAAAPGAGAGATILASGDRALVRTAGDEPGTGGAYAAVRWAADGELAGYQAVVDRAAALGADLPAPPPGPALPGLRAELLALAAEDQEARATGDPLKWGPVDRFTAVRLGEIVDRHGWPGRSLVGADGARAAWLLVQHADAKPAFQRRCLVLLRKAVAAGEAAGEDLAYLEDRVATAAGKPQVYGTQFMLHHETNLYEPQPIADPDHVDARRKAIGLPTLAEYTAIMNRGRVPNRLAVRRPDYREALLRQAFRGTPAAARELERLIRRHGWPTSSAVGQRAVDEAVALAVKGRLDLAFLRAFARAQGEAFAKGETAGGTYAYLVDSLRRREGLKQLYGTDFVWAHGRWTASPIHDPAGLEARRARLKMMPFARWERFMRDMPPPRGKEEP